MLGPLVTQIKKNYKLFCSLYCSNTKFGLKLNHLYMPSPVLYNSRVILFKFACTQSPLTLPSCILQ